MVVKYSNNKVLSFCLTMQSCTGDLNLDVSKKVLISVKKSLKYKTPISYEPVFVLY